MFNRLSTNPVTILNTESNINNDLVDAVQYTTRFLSAVGRYHHVSCTEYFVPSYSLVFNDNFAARSEEPNNKLVFDRGADAQEDQIEVNELIPVKLPKALDVKCLNKNKNTDYSCTRKIKVITALRLLITHDMKPH